MEHTILPDKTIGSVQLKFISTGFQIGKPAKFPAN